MEEIAGSALAGLVAALTATFILVVLKWIHERYLEHLDVRQIQEVLTDGRKRVMEKSKETFNPNMNVTLHADVLRAAQYNLMIKQLRVALDHTTSKLSYAKRKDIFDALDWYGVKSLYATKDVDGSPVFVDRDSFAKATARPVGSWPTSEMQENQAIDKFKCLEAIKWLKLEPYMLENG